MRFKKLIIGAILVLVLLMLSAWIYRHLKSDEEVISLVKEESFLIDFDKNDEEVLIYCELVINNTYSSRKEVKITGVFTEDYLNGFLKEETLEAYSVDFLGNTFVLEEGKNRIEVVFFGTSGGFDRKANRLLPVISIFEIDR